MMDLQGDPKGLSIGGLVVITKSTSLTVKLLGTDHYFPGGDAGEGGGEVYCKIFPCKRFLIYAPVQKLYFETQTFFFTNIVFASNLFCLIRPCKQFFFNIFFHTPPSKKIMVRPLSFKI